MLILRQEVFNPLSAVHYCLLNAVANSLQSHSICGVDGEARDVQFKNLNVNTKYF